MTNTDKILNQTCPNYIPQIDGIRAIAILAVLSYHVMPDILPGGFTGVDVFFVLSGYLISYVILCDIRAKNFSLKEFYLRRIQRLLPNAILMIFTTIIISLIILPSSSTILVSKNALWALFNVSNLYIWKNLGGYWGEIATSSPLLHTWSLAIEEQFYLIFPAILLILTRRLHTNIITLMILCLLSSVALYIYGSWSHPGATFYLLPTQVWELLLGIVLAGYRVPVSDDRPIINFERSKWTELSGWLGLCLVLTGFMVITEKNLFPGLVAFIPTIGTLAIIMSIVDGKTSVSWLLSRSPMVKIGKLSYSIYLWHWPLIVICTNLVELMEISRRTASFIGATLGILFAVIAYYFVEQPLRSRGPNRRGPLLLIVYSFSGIVVVSLVFSLYRPATNQNDLFDQISFTGLNYDVVFEEAITDKIEKATKFSDVLFPSAPAKPNKIWMNGGIIHRWGNNGKPRVVVLGSSHALMYSLLIDDICGQLNLPVAFFCANATPVFFSATINAHFPNKLLSHSFDESRRKWLRKWQPDVVIAIDAWGNYAADNVDFYHKFRGLVDELSLYTKQIIVLTQVPVLRVGELINAREFVKWHYNIKGVLPKITPNLNEPLRQSTTAIMEAATHEFKKLQILRVDRYFYTRDGFVRYSLGRSFLYADDDHLSDAGAEVVREIIKSAIKKAF